MLYSKKFDSSMEAIGQVLNEALEVLSKHNWCTCQQDNFCLRLCLEEALVNAMIHGNKNESGRTVHIEIFEDGPLCRIRVRDQGNGFDPESIDMPDCSELGGRGVCLIKHFMQDLRFDKKENCLEMAFSKGCFAEKQPIAGGDG